TAVPSFDQWDGFRVIMEQRDARNGDSVLFKRRFTFHVDTNGTARREEDLSRATGWDSLAQVVTVVLALKGGTTIDTVGTSPDSGYSAEMKIILTGMGYPAGRGDGVLFLGATHFDGDIFPTGKYGTRTWFMREGDWDDGAAWMYMDPGTPVSVDEGATTLPTEFALLGNYPNPFNPSTTIKFTMARSSEVRLDVYDVLGRLVASESLGVRTPGTHAVKFNAANLASGSYFYRLTMAATGATQVGKMMLLK
ncbi:MAG: T9SS type A sorting domain-containing protein, partial [Bacteroidota bacterium]